MSNKNKVLIICGVLVGVVVLLGLAWYYGIGRNYPIYTNIEKINEYPEIGWNEITSGRLGRFLQKSGKAGMLPKMLEGVVPLAEVGITSDSYFADTKIRFVELANLDVKLGKYTNSNSRPYHFVAFYRTKIGTDKYLILVQEWKNKDRLMSYLPLLLYEEKAINTDGLTKYFREVVMPNDNYFLSPIMQYESKETCKSTVGKVKGVAYCDWYFASKRSGIFEGMMREWVDNGVVPQDMSKYPVLFTVSPVGGSTK